MHSFSGREISVAVKCSTAKIICFNRYRSERGGGAIGPLFNPNRITNKTPTDTINCFTT